MNRLIIICEGETEQEFCKDVLQPYFFQRDLIIEFPLIKKSSGGIVKWSELGKQIKNHLLQDRTAYVTTLIDYYGLYKKHNFPKWEESLLIQDKNNRMICLENGMKESLEEIDTKSRFIPYIQLHEFEGLLFNDIEVFTKHIGHADINDFNELNNIIINHPNPELINDNYETAPSKRLKRLIKGYNKIVYGSLLAEAIGLTNIMDKCPRFNDWIKKLEKI